jgi:hypothetical protein
VREVGIGHRSLVCRQIQAALDFRSGPDGVAQKPLKLSVGSAGESFGDIRRGRDRGTTQLIR